MNLTSTLIIQLKSRLRQDASIAVRAGTAAKDAAQNSVTAMEKRQDSRVMIEQGNMAYAQSKRARLALEYLQALESFDERGFTTYHMRSKVGLGAVVDAQCETEEGHIGRTFVMLPVGAGEELTGPDGDGIITVLTPQSPVGKAMFGKRVGEVAEVTIKREPWEWEILEVSC
jgi:transcription elongation GreA/GreB family factor